MHYFERFCPSLFSKPKTTASVDKHLSAYRMISLAGCAVLFVAFLLFLLVGLSATIIKSIFLLAIRSTVIEHPPTSIATDLKFGVWGVCATSQLEPNAPTCFGPRLGYDVSSFVDLSDAGVSPAIVNVVEDALLAVLALHPIVAGLAFLSLGSSLFLASHGFAILTLILAIITALIASVSMAIDLALVLVARGRLGTFSIEIDFGNGVWMTVLGVILTWTAVVLHSARACYCLGVRRHSCLEEKPTTTAVYGMSL